MADLEWTGERLVTQIDNPAVIEHLHRYAIALDLLEGNHVVLDVASGEGYGCNLMAGKASAVYGVDISKEAVSHANEKYGNSKCKFTVGSTSKIPHQDHVFDVVTSFETIEHHDEHEQMMLEISRVLKPNGICIISSPDKLNYSDKPQYKNPFHVKELYKEEFVMLMKKHFKHVTVLGQVSGFYSVVAVEGPNNGFAEYAGNFTQLQSLPSITLPVYNMIIASNGEMRALPASVFKAENVLQNINDEWNERYQKKNDQVNELLNSKTYKVGNIIVSPLRYLISKLKS